MDVLRVDAAKMRRLWQIVDEALPAGDGRRGEMLDEARRLVRDMLGVSEDDSPGEEMPARAGGQHAVGEEGYQ